MLARWTACPLLLTIASAIGPKAVPLAQADAADPKAEADPETTQDLVGEGHNETDAAAWGDEEDLGPLSAEEIAQFMEEADSDKDGHLSLKEILADLEAYNEDGELMADSEPVLREAFAEADADGDGRLSSEELLQSERFQGALVEEGEDSDGPRPRHDLDPTLFPEGDDEEEELSGEFRATLEEIQEYVKEVDMNRDGKVSVEEMVADVKNEMAKDPNFDSAEAQKRELKIMRKAFSAADANVDGFLSVEEILDSESFMNEIFSYRDDDEDADFAEL